MSFAETGLSTSGLCEPWPINEECCEIPDGMPEDRVEHWKLTASEILWRASGMRYGPGCPIEIRPCGKSCWEEMVPITQRGVPSAGGIMFPYIGADGAWRNCRPCACRTDCSCEQLCELRLDGPVHDIVRVVVDGEQLPAESYRLDPANRLVRLDGDCWPACVDMLAPLGEEGTYGVVYRPGIPLDMTARMAVSELWCALIKNDKCGKHKGECECGECAAMQRNVTRVTRQGVSMEFDAEKESDAIQGFELTPLAEAWLKLVNPHNLTRASTVRSPDVRHPRNRIIQQWGRRY